MKPRYLPLLFLITVLLSTGSYALREQDYRDWQKITDKNGVQVYRAHSEMSKFKTLKGITVIPMDDLLAFLASMEDMDAMKSWMHQVNSVSMVKEFSEAEREVYVEVMMPWPLKDRDVYAHLEIIQEEDYSLYMDVRAATEDYPENEGFVRIPNFDGYISAEPIEGTRDVVVTYEMHVDPGGSLPAWIVNLITADVPYFTLQRMKKVLEMDKYIGKEYEMFERRPWVTEEGEPPVAE